MCGQPLRSPFRGRGPPREAALREPLVAEPEPLAIVHEHLQRRRSAIAEDEDRADERVVLERVLAEHPAVAACAVIGCPDREWGERVTAVVVLEKGESVSASDLIAFCRERLAPYKSPKAVVFQQELPRNAMGKVQKAELRKSICSA